MKRALLLEPMNTFTPKQLATLVDVLWRYPALQMRVPGLGSNGLAQVLVWLACSGQTDFTDLQSIVAWGMRCVRVEQEHYVRALCAQHNVELDQ